MKDHYKTLGLEADATAVDVKRAFRSMAKQYHPDRNAGRLEWATTRMKLVLEAHRVLSSATLRAIYDKTYEMMMARGRGLAYQRFVDEGDGPAAKARRILTDLLSGNAREAVALYEEQVKRDGGFELRYYMEIRDWVDCKFLIAEHYQAASEYEKALALYEELYGSSDARERYSHFIDEIHDRILKLCCRDLAPSAEPAAAAQYYLRALGMGLTRGRRAHLHKKVAECHLAVGDLDSARRQLGIAFRLKPDLKGAMKICERLGFSRD